MKTGKAVTFPAKGFNLKAFINCHKKFKPIKDNEKIQIIVY